MIVSFKSNNGTESVHCKLLIGADGANSNVADKLGFQRAKELLRGYGSNDASPVDIDSDFVKIFSGNEIAPGFFAWLIPSVRVGLCTSRGDKSPRYYFEKLLNNPEFKKISGNMTCGSYTAGIIPISKIDKIYSDNVMLVGDAASQVKPLSGGGVYTGLKGAIHCANVAVRALENGNYTRNILKMYQLKWDEEFRKEMKRAYLIRKIVRDLEDKQIEEGFDIFNDKKLLSMLNKKGDIDYPTKLALPVLKSAPKLMKFTGPIMKSLL
jgi:flavin-dependent dehydrogenase